MSVNLIWSKLTDEENLSKFQQFLNEYFDTKIRKPDYIGKLHITHLRIGTKEPSLSLLDVTDVFEDFYSDELNEKLGAEVVIHETDVMVPHSVNVFDSMNSGRFYNPFQSLIQRKQQTSQEHTIPSRYPSSSPIEPHVLTSKSRNSTTSKWSSKLDGGTTLTMDAVYSEHPQDFQMMIHVDYESDLELSIETELLINYPVPSFMSLPVRLTVKDLVFQGDILVAITQGEFNFCIYESEDTKFNKSTENDTTDQDTIEDEIRSPLKEILIESEIGDIQKQALKNVDKITHFVKHHLRKILEEYCIFPKCLTIQRENA